MEIIKETLPNGLTVILAPIEATKSITEVFMTRAGWKYEWPEIYGLSHFIEHMTFKGTAKRPGAQDITREIEGKGGTINAFTEPEYTGYWVKISKRFIDVVHDVISDNLLNSKFEPDQIEIERGPIVEEMHMCHDIPQSHVWGTLWPKLLYGRRPAGQNGLGTKESLEGLEREHFLDYIGKLYVASNSVVGVAGRIDRPSQVLEDLDRYFQRISQGKPGVDKLKIIERQREPKILFEKRETDQTHVVLGVRSYNIFHPDRYALKVLEIILGGNMSSRMFREVRDLRGLAYDISTHTAFQTDAGWLATYAGLNPEKVIEGLEVIVDQYRKIAEEEVSESELRAAKDFILGQMEIGLEESDKLVSFLVERFILTGEYDTPEQAAEKFERVSPEDIQRVAQDIFQTKKLNLAIVGPHPRNMKEKLYPILRF